LARAQPRGDAAERAEEYLAGLGSDSFGAPAKSKRGKKR
jgi:hypothetical protein